MITPSVCYCKAQREWVYDSRMAFQCGTKAQVIRGKWHVTRSLDCLQRIEFQEKMRVLYGDNVDAGLMTGPQGESRK